MRSVVSRLTIGTTAMVMTFAVAEASQHVHAATVVVNTVADAASGGCETSGTGPNCTLREAVIYGNNHPGTVITVPAGTYVLSVQTGTPEGNALTGDLDIHEDLTINGAGPQSTIITGNLGANDRILDIYPPGLGATETRNVAINGVTLTGGVAADTYGGGAVWIGGRMDVTMTNTVITRNHSFDAVGGHIVVEGPGAHLSLSGSIVDDAQVESNSDEAALGGGIYVHDASLDLVDSVISHNQALGANAPTTAAGTGGGEGRGGGLYVDTGSTVTVTRSLIAHNSAWGGSGQVAAGNEVAGGKATGGGLYARSASQLNIDNSTLTDNFARGGLGPGGSGVGGIAEAGGAFSSATLSVVHTTIADNHALGGPAPQGGSQGQASGGGFVAFFAGGSMANSIVAGNSVDPAPVPAFATDLRNPIAFGHNNLIGVADGATNVGPTDLSGTPGAPLDPKLVPLADHGGPTQTLGLMPGSPAIDAAAGDACAAAGNIDQRGAARPNPPGGRCDIGAFEYAFTPTTVALSSSVSPAAVGQAVTFTATVSGAGGTPSGIVTIMDGATAIGGGSVAGGVVALTTAALVEGTHSITAQYSGDSVFAPSSASIVQVVGDGSVSTVGLQFFALPRPIRLLDTRPGQSAFVHPGTPLIANQPIAVPGRVTVDGVTIPSEARALVGNATVDNSAGVPAGFATLWPGGSPLPLASNLNFVPGTVRPNQFTVGLGGDGSFNVLSNTGGHFIVDVTGYYAPPASGGLYFHPLPQPVRLLDTRSGASAFVHPDVALTPGQTLTLPGQFSSAGVTVPVTAKALAGNATVDNTINAPPGFATLFPGGTALPPTSNLNFASGTIAPNAFTVGLGADGSFNLFSQSGSNFVIDVTGYYDSVPAGGMLFHPLAQPVRELDTRPGASAASHPNAPVAAAGTLNLAGAFAFVGITVPSNATALVGNATVDNTINAPAGFATIFPGATALPLASNLNYSPGLVAPNAFIVAVGADGTYNLYSQSETNYIIDISGYFAIS